MNTVIITGATGGLGSCVFNKLLSRHTYAIIPIFRNKKKFNSLYVHKTSNVFPYEIDYKENYSNLLNVIPVESDEIVLIHTAFSIDPLNKIGKYIPEDLDCIFDINICQPVKLINLLVNFCERNQKKLRIINLDSGAADYPLKGWGTYGSCKSFMNSFLNVLKLENDLIKIVSVDPGVIDTDMQYKIRNLSEDVFDKVKMFKDYKENGLLRNPETVADYLLENYLDNWNASAIREKVKL